MSTTARLIGVRGYPRQALDWMASEHPSQPLATAAIAEKLGIWLSDIHSLMFNMVKAGYMQKLVDPADARRTLYAITPAGIEHSKLLAQLPEVAPVKLGLVHRRHAAKVLESNGAGNESDAPASDAEASDAQPTPTLAFAQALAGGTVVALQQPNGERMKCDAKQRAADLRKVDGHDDYVKVVPKPRAPDDGPDTIGPAMPDEPDAVDVADGGASTDQTPNDADGATVPAQPETRQHARLAHKMGRPLFAVGPTGEVRVLLPRLGMSVYLQPDTLHKLAAASALVRQAGGLA